jgi:hypothetical protein
MRGCRQLGEITAIGGIMLKVKASDLAEALKPARPHLRKKQPKPVPVSLEFDLTTGMLTGQKSRNARICSTSGHMGNAVESRP